MVENFVNIMDMVFRSINKNIFTLYILSISVVFIFFPYGFLPTNSSYVNTPKDQISAGKP